MIAKTLAALLVVFSIGVAARPAAAQEDQPLTPRQVEAVRKVVKAYLMEHPEVISDAIEALREKMRVEADSDAKKAIDAYKDELFNAKDDPVAGNPKGDVTLVEFFDYNCGFCKQTMDAMFDAVKADGKVKLVFKEFPILTDDSVVGSRIALAAVKQGKYDDIHRAFMKYHGRLDEKAMWKLAADAGINIDQVKRDVAAPEIDKQLHRNMELAHALDISGTPAFVIGDHILSGAMEQAVFRQLFDNARKAKTAQQ
jgi:protein-disulfide isomerase